jgi:ferredoxin
MRVIIDLNRCESNALCMDACPEVFEVRGDDRLHLLNESPAEHLRERVEQAVRACPKQAIRVDG